MCPTLIECKWVRVMADYSSDGIWGKDGAGECLDDLPVSAELKKRLAAWQRQFDDEALSEPEFSIEGLLIAQEIKKTLPDWTVVYFDNAASDRIEMWTGGDRSAFEYEVAAP